MMVSYTECKQIQEALNVPAEKLLSLLTTYQECYGQQEDCRNFQEGGRDHL